jgi:hypothetical protein
MNCIKTTCLILFMCITTLSFSQDTLKYSDLSNGIKPVGEFTYYLSKDGSVYKVGDKIQFSTPSGINGKFVSIQKIDIMGNLYIVGVEAVNTSAEIKKIRIGGTKRSGFKASFQTKGFTGIDNYFLSIEDGITLGEVKSLGMTSDEALSKLKKAKDKLDLGLITQEEFDKVKSELSPYIK